MTTLEESVIDDHILTASNLRVKSRGYKALESLLSVGNLLCTRFGDDYSLFVSFTRVLDHLCLEYQFIPNGLELKENAKLNYFQNVMNHVVEVKPKQKYEANRIGKEERAEYGGWIRTRENDI